MKTARFRQVIIRYKNRCGAIRVEEGRGTVSKELAAAAKKLAKEPVKEHLQFAMIDSGYAEGVCPGYGA